jgi:hypothetical protein
MRLRLSVTQDEFDYSHTCMYTQWAVISTCACTHKCDNSHAFMYTQEGSLLTYKKTKMLVCPPCMFVQVYHCHMVCINKCYCAYVNLSSPQAHVKISSIFVICVWAYLSYHTHTFVCVRTCISELSYPHICVCTHMQLRPPVDVSATMPARLCIHMRAIMPLCAWIRKSFHAHTCMYT